MKISSIAMFAALVASASAKPIRVYALSSEPLPPVEEISYRINAESEPLDEIKTLPFLPFEHSSMHKPCHGKSQISSFKSLLVKLGFVEPDLQSKEKKMEDIHETLFEHFKGQIENVENKIIPLLESGSVKILPFEKFSEDDEMKLPNEIQQEEMKWWRHLEEDKWIVRQGVKGEWRLPNSEELPPIEIQHQSSHHHHGHQHGHGFMANTIPGRLHKALGNLKPIESIVLAFVIGAGLGSIIHFFFMLFLLTFRYFKAGCPSKEERRSRRLARKEARKAKKAERRGLILSSNSIQGQDGEEEELLPAYEGNGFTDEKTQQA
ncbi:uncharacterized protein I206_101211 [Kwoniella pini CBS 10737]|uniref:Uncharacterized protein n=1 Tax=Kwoniella pini CBS 10737 TaxID=1296096 RepID=A0A1B9IB83_9TREE|nr:uncharacterized protein I206_00112 [Kwoniella pini CBS 10737]OCF52816.1 hypothetical protein I206_00112 [Kwoniella pini CBS 10737]